MLTLLDHLPQGGTIVRVLRHWLAEVPRLTRPVIDDQREMVSGNGAPNGGAALLHGLNCGASGCVLQHDAELGEGLMNLE